MAIGGSVYEALAQAARAGFVRYEVKLKGYEGPNIAWAISFEDLKGTLRHSG